MQHTTAVVVARFQAQRLTPGHVHLLNTALLQNSAVLLYLGCSPVKGGRKNPVPFVWRASMVQNDPRVYRAGRCLIIKEVHDKGNDDVWSSILKEDIEKTIQEYGLQGTKLRLYGSRDSSFLSGFKSDSERVELLPFAEFSATELREQIAHQYPTGRERDDAVREGMIMAAYNHYPTVISTVDNAILQKIDGKVGVWLGRKPTSKKFRFIGGFAEPTSPSDEADAIREAFEETGLTVVMPHYIGSTLIDDWRFRGEVDKIRTRFFASVVAGGEPKGADDIAEVKFVPFAELRNLPIEDLHGPLGAMFINWMESARGVDYIGEFLLKNK